MSVRPFQQAVVSTVLKLARPAQLAQPDAIIARNATSVDRDKVARDAYLKQVTSRIASRSR
jgi:hypothetical protein